ncbi:hypothetical protein [Azospirillum brasilense]|uniref:hypothetical protein n=1 Tax=Azospirillum brasilense TaxID=192 RepID=UPI0011A3D94A|nr:hypothetical protein [Azospirillum brasilense]
MEEENMRIQALIAFVLLSGCVAQIQDRPKLVGRHDGQPLYSFFGFTKVGDTTEQGAYKVVSDYLKKTCPRGNPSIVDITTELTKHFSSPLLRWNATFTCSELDSSAASYY